MTQDGAFPTGAPFSFGIGKDASMDSFDLMVHVAAEDWAYAQRRLAWLEALLLWVVRDTGQLPEWYDAAELAALRLPGLPASRSGIANRATAENWPRIKVQGRKGHRFAYHVSSLPARAFDALIIRILDLPPFETVEQTLLDVTPAPAPELPRANMAPAWVLPLMRLLRNEAQGDLAAAWQRLPRHLPAGTPLPDVNQAAKILVKLGLA